MKKSVRGKLNVVFGSILVLILVLGSIGVFSSYKLNDNTKAINEGVLPKIQFNNDLEQTVQQMLSNMQRHLVSKDRPFEEKYEEAIRANQEQLKATESAYKKALPSDERPAFDAVQAQLDKYNSQIDDLLRMSAAGNKQDAIQNSYETGITIDEIRGDLLELEKAHKKELNAIEEEGKALYLSVLITMIAGAILALIFAGIGIRYLQNRIQKPITIITNRMTDMAAGKLTPEPLLVGDPDEIGQLTKDANTLSDNLYRIISELQTSISTIASTSGQLTASADETAQASTQITEDIVDISEGSSEQMEHTNSTTSIVAEITQGMDQTATAIHKVSDLAISTTEETQNGASIMDQTVRKIEGIQQSTDHTASVVYQLSKKSEAIGSIVALITNVAGQTNLLALNASIEAARAGEHGKGFAVVAGEVGSLAAESAKAASEINRLIEEIQKEVTGVQQATQVTKSDVAVGLTLANRSGERFREIAEMISEVSAQTEEVSAISEEISASTHTMKALVGQVAQLSEKSEESAQNIVAAAEEQNATMEEISASAHVLSEMAESLKTMIDVFELETGK
ncbi:methyl-accepting chemotaxis protein [Sporosarcina gallistercoris]|uniref:Methyl-accepting chemotaxis protein n=1 Tax=Sporosarcina gallistercoris TaxID=2762245 RepID=A0ABR8PLD8_9BACL|nr:methyl-accepting chemotaxis protein [Sporosarcina gallistercoris]MBD7908985.1 methyl-accepting chemotaxis protein [Sporosarcina gallistercoris]